MKKLIILVGISGSGKSTWTTEYIQKNPDTLRINRDDIRKSLVGTLKNYYQNKNIKYLENTVTIISEDILKRLLTTHFSIIIDNTNLKIKDIERILELAKNILYEVEFKFIECPLPKAKLRVYTRDFLEKNCNPFRIEYDNIRNLEALKYIDKQYIKYEQIKNYIIKNNYEYETL